MPVSPFLFEIVYIYIFNAEVAFQNPHLFDFSSKIHETNSVGFLNSNSIHKNYKTHQ
jgi:hypothetical protein